VKRLKMEKFEGKKFCNVNCEPYLSEQYIWWIMKNHFNAPKFAMEQVRDLARESKGYNCTGYSPEFTDIRYAIMFANKLEKKYRPGNYQGERNTAMRTSVVETSPIVDALLDVKATVDYSGIFNKYKKNHENYRS